MTFACFHISGKNLRWRDKLKRLVSGLDVVSGVGFKTWGLIPSGPSSFDGLRVIRISYTSFSVLLSIDLL